MPKYKIRNSFHSVTWEVNSLLMKFRQCMSCYKIKNFIKKSYKNCFKASFRSFTACKELVATYIGKWNF